MNCFNKDYSNFYDLIYKDKKYNDEISSVKRIIRKYSKNKAIFFRGTIRP